MKVIPVASPHAVAPTQSSEQTRTNRAVQAFNKLTNPPAPIMPDRATESGYPVSNPNAISVEELGAIQAKTVENTDTSAVIEEQAPEAPVEQPTEKKEDPALSRQFAQLARQERALRAKAQQQEQAYKQREADLAAREAALKGQPQQDLSQYITKDRIKQDALSVLDEAGVSYDELTQQIISRQPTDPRVSATISKLEAKIAQLEQANENTQKSYTEQQQASYEAAKRQIGLDARDLVNSDPEFETIKATNSVKDVVDLIVKTYEKDGVVLSVEEAAKEVESYLMEEAMKLTRIEKIKRQIAQSSATTKPSQQTQPTKQSQPQMKTLTNATASSRQLSAKERAILAFKGELKS